MPDHTDERIRALIVELAEHAPVAPSLQDLDDRGTTVGQARRPRALKVGAIAAASVALIVGVLLTRPEDRSSRVRAGAPSTTTTAPVNRPLRLSPTVLPAGFVEKPGTGGLGFSFGTGNGALASQIFFSFGTTGTSIAGVLPPAMVQSSLYTRGAAGQSDFAALGLFVGGPTDGTAAHPTGVQRRIGDRLVTVSRAQGPGAGSSTAVVATSATWREAGYAVSVIAFGVTDAELEAFIGGLRAAEPQVGDIVGQLEKQPDGSCKGSFGVGGSDEPGEGGTIVAGPDAECTVRIKEITSDPTPDAHGPGG